MHGNEIIILALLFITGYVSSDNNIYKNTVNKTIDEISNATEAPVTTTIPTSTSTSSTTTTTTTTSTTTELPPITTPESFPLLEDLISAEESSIKRDNDHDDEKNTAKRTISSRFTGPIIVNEERKLFTPNEDEFTRKQRINVQIIEPEFHNNGQFLKETVFVRHENNTVITTTTTSTTERPNRRKNIVIEQKFATPILPGQRSNDAKQRQLSNGDDDCDDVTERANIFVTEKNNRIVENVDIQQNTKIQKIIYKDEPKPSYVFGARVASTTRPTPCEQALPCSTPRVAFKASPTPRLRPINSTPLTPPRVYTTPRVYSTPRVVTTPRIVTSTLVSAPRIVTSSVPVFSTASPLPLKNVPIVTQKPAYIHTHSEVPVIQKEYVQLPPKIIEKPVVTEKPVYIHTHSEVPVVQKEYVQLPPKIIEKPVVTEKPVYIHTHSEVPVVQKEYVQLPPKIIERPVVTEKPVYIHTHSEVPIVQKEYVQLPPKIIEKPVIQKEFVQLPPQVQVIEKPKVVVQKEFVHLPPQERIVPVEVEKLVVKEVPINNIIEKHIQHPPTVVEKLVPYPVASKPIEVERIVEVPVDRVVEKPVPVNHVVEKPVAVPYVQYVDRPIHIPYILPVEVPVAYHVPYIVKQPHPPPPKQHIIIKTTKYGKHGHGLFDWKHNHHKHIKHVIFKKPTHLLPDDIIAPPTIDSIGLLPPPRYQPYISEDFGPKASASINVVSAVLPNSVHNNRNQFFEPSPIANGYGSYDSKRMDSFAKDIRWEFGFKPPLVPSVAIDEFGNPLNEN